MSAEPNDSTDIVDNLNQQILDKQEKELSYIKEASNASEQRTKYLAKQNKFGIAFDDGTTRIVDRKPLSNKKSREIDDLRTAFATTSKIDPDKPLKIKDQTFTDINDVIYFAMQKTAEYCLGLTAEEYDNAIAEDDDENIKKDIWGTRSILLACLTKAVHGQAYFQKPSKSS